MANWWDSIISPFKYLQRYLSRIDLNLPHKATGDEIALILSTNLFRKMTEDELAKLISSITIRKYQAGDLIIEEGESGNELFIISDGTASVFITDESGNKIQLKVLLPGNYFGEQAITGQKFKTRNASIEAISDISLIRIQGKYVSQLLRVDASFKNLVEERKVNQAMNIVAHASIFQKEIEALLANIDNPHVMEFRNKECIFKAGDKADRVYMVIQGKVKLLIPHKNNASMTEMIINKGHLFGELGVMNNTPRAATAIADGNVRLLGIDGDDFKNDVSISDSFKAKLASLQRMYALPLRGTIEQYTRIVPNLGISIMNIYKLDDGRVVHSSKFLEQDQFTMWSEDNSLAKGIKYEHGNDHVELFVREQHLIGIKANGNYESLPELCYMLLDQVKIEAEDIELFKRTGKLKDIITT